MVIGGWNHSPVSWRALSTIRVCLSVPCHLRRPVYNTINEFKSPLSVSNRQLINVSIYNEINNRITHEKITKINVFEKSNISWKIVATDCGNIRQKHIITRPENVIDILEIEQLSSTHPINVRFYTQPIVSQTLHSRCCWYPTRDNSKHLLDPTKILLSIETQNHRMRIIAKSTTELGIFRKCSADKRSSVQDKLSVYWPMGWRLTIISGIRI